MIADLHAEDVVHGERAMRAKLERAVSKELARRVLTLYENGGSVLSYGQVTSAVAADESFAALTPLAQKWARKSSQFFGAELVGCARSKLGVE